MTPARFALAGIGAGSAALYGLLAWRYPLGPSLTIPRASWGLLTTPNAEALAFHLSIYLGLTLLYMAALRLLTPSSSSGPRRRLLMWILAVWLICSAVLLTVAAAGESHDVFDYLFRGRMMAELGANPLAEIPKAYKTAPFYFHLAWHSNVDTYGPLWEMTSAGVAVATRWILSALGLWTTGAASCPDSPLACRMLAGYVTAYRLLAIGLTGVSAGLIAGMVGRVRPELVPAAVAAWLWNPLLLMSTAVGAHNDALMIVLVLGCLWLWQHQRWIAGLLVLVLAAHVKLIALILLPALGLWLVRRQGWQRTLGIALVAGGLGVALSWLLYAPFGGWGTLPRMLAERAVFSANSPWQILTDLLHSQWAWPARATQQWVALWSTGLYGLGAVLISLWMLNFRPRRLARTNSPMDGEDDRLLWRTLAALSLFYLAVGSFWFQHWYVVWLLAPAALLANSRLTQRVLPWLAGGALAANVVSDFLMTTTPKGAPLIGIYAWTVILIWLPALLAAAQIWIVQITRHSGKSR